MSRNAQRSFVDAVHEVLARVPGAFPQPCDLASAAVFCGQPLQFEELQSVYTAVESQPPYPWSIDLL